MRFKTLPHKAYTHKEEYFANRSSHGFSVLLGLLTEFFRGGPSATQKSHRNDSKRSSHARTKWGGIFLSATLLPG
jgi:hypothetical protein